MKIWQICKEQNTFEPFSWWMDKSVQPSAGEVLEMQAHFWVLISWGILGDGRCLEPPSELQTSHAISGCTLQTLPQDPAQFWVSLPTRPVCRRVMLGGREDGEARGNWPTCCLWGLTRDLQVPIPGTVTGARFVNPLAVELAEQPVPRSVHPMPDPLQFFPGTFPEHWAYGNYLLVTLPASNCSWILHNWHQHHWNLPGTGAVPRGSEGKWSLYVFI